jgi:hypothetical protein
MTHDEIRKNHFARLNGYRQSAEYAAYARTIGAEVPQGDLPSLLGNRWEIDEAVYDEFLGMLPPMGWRGGAFYMSEFSFDDITAKFSKDGDRYYCEFARYPGKEQSPTATPWGHPDTVREIATGIVSYSTPSHGGIWLSDARVASMPKPLREFSPWAGPNWYEEDCDWAVVAAAFPQFFKPDEVTAAMKTLEGYKPAIFAEVSAMRAGGRGA